MRGARAAAALVVLAPFVLGATSAPQGPRGREVFRFQDPAIVESSGLAWVGPAGDGLVATTNDSGDTGRVFAVDPVTGATAGTTTWGTAVGDPEDVEALAPAGDDAVWVADIGDNLGRRDSVLVVRVPVGRGDRSVRPAAHRLAWPRGPRDAETLLRHPRTGRLYLVDKGVLGGTLAAAPRRLRTDRVNRLQPVGPVLGLATDGAFWPDGRHVVLRSYARAVVYAFPSLEPVGDLPLPAQDQGEGLAVTPDGRVLVSSEGIGQPVLEVRVPARLRRTLEAPASPASPGAAESSGSAVPSPQQPTAGDGVGTGGASPLLVAGAAVGALALGGVVAAPALRARRRRGPPARGGPPTPAAD
jgi:hypothetical protein